MFKLIIERVMVKYDKGFCYSVRPGGGGSLESLLGVQGYSSNFIHKSESHVDG